VYFSDFGAAMDCTRVQPVKRQVAETEAVATAALQELFEGTTEAERNRGLSSPFDATSPPLLRSVRVEDGTAYVDLDASALNINNVTTTCGSASFFSTVEATVEQFPTVKETRLAVEGDPRRFYEFMGIGCDGQSSELGRCDPEPFRR
jgi:spore germination protein GerM